MRLIWSPEALRDLTDVRAFIAKDHPEAAAKVGSRIVGLVSSQLPTSPQSGRVGRVDGTREQIGPGTPFVVPYRVVSDTVQMLRVYHAARIWPNSL